MEIGALAAAFANGESFTVEDPYGAESIVSLGEKAGLRGPGLGLSSRPIPDKLD